MSTTIIGLCGPAGAGKSTIAKYLVEKYGAHTYSLAGPLKQIAQRVLGFTDAQLYGTQAQKEAADPRYGFSARWFLQRLGTEGCRAVMGEDIWTTTCLRQIERDRPRVAVIEDVRFKNEALAIESWQCGIHDLESEDIGHVWRLFPSQDVALREASAGKHASELEWRDAVATVELFPSRGLESLYAEADRAAELCGLK